MCSVQYMYYVVTLSNEYFEFQSNVYSFSDIQSLYDLFVA